MIRLTCPHCDKELKAADDRAGRRVGCPRCKGVLLVPQPLSVASAPLIEPPDSLEPAPSESRSELSWMQWLLRAGSPDQTEVRRVAKANFAALAAMSRQLEQLLRTTEAAVETSVAQLRGDRIVKVLRSTPVEHLKGSAPSVRVALLQQNGYRSMLDVRQATAGRLRQIRGIGPVSASLAMNAVDRLHDSIARERLTLPLPTEMTQEYGPLLSVTYQRLALRQESRLLEELQSFAGAYRGALAELRYAGRIWNRLFRRRESEPACEAAFARLAELNDSPVPRELVDRFGGLVGRLKPPATFESLVRDYQERFADYFAVLDRYLDPAEATEVASRGRHGGVPAKIAQEVEKVQLSLGGLDVTLRGYQEFGAKYLIHQRRTVLGDEMGLGKTIQALAAIVHLRNTESARHFLIVCPASIIGNWAHEIERRTNIPLHVVHGRYREETMQMWLSAGGIAVTSYQMLVRNFIDRGSFRVDLLIVDEAHYVKNPGAKRTAAVRQVSKACERVALMTGTVLENRAEEFADIVGICDQELGLELAREALRFGAKRFEGLVAPVYLRRNQFDVLKELPECIEIEEWLSLEPRDGEDYTIALESKNIMAMRRAAIGTSTKSTKMRRLAELRDEYADAGKKIVVFSFFLDALTLAGMVLGEHSRIDGSVLPARRMEIIESFNKKQGFAAMVCQINSGGVGINLQSASAVVLLEPQYKPTTEWQAIKRVHRMGQSSRVVVHRFYSLSTVEESLYELVGFKALVFDVYARESAVKNASAAASDASDKGIEKKLLELELRRLQSA